MDVDKLEHDNMSLSLRDDKYQFTQDISVFLKQAAQEREISSINRGKSGSMRKLATIPDIVALEIKANHDIDIHDPETSQNRYMMAKFKTILKSEYPLLLSN